MAGFFLMIMGAVAFVLRIPAGSEARGGIAETFVISGAWLVVGLFGLLIGGTLLMCAGRSFCASGNDLDAWMPAFMGLFIVAPAILVIAISAIGRRLG